jgi:hypothetical protein
MAGAAISRKRAVAGPAAIDEAGAILQVWRAVGLEMNHTMLSRLCSLQVAAMGLAFTILPAWAAAPTARDVGSEWAQYLTHHGYGVMRVDTEVGSNKELLMARLNGHWETLVVDTGCTATTVTHSSAVEMGLNVILSKGGEVGIGGVVKNNGVGVLKSFTLNNYEINRTNTIRVMSPDAHMTVNGLFGLDYMRLNAVILLVGTDFFFFKPGATPVADSAPYMKELGYQAVPLSYGPGGLRVEGTLDGHPVSAVVDSGNAYTFYDSDFVLNTVGAFLRGSRRYVVGIDGRHIPRAIFNARNMTFGPMSFGSNESSAASDTLLKPLKAQALLGYDLLAAHQAIIDLGHNVLWMQ